MVHVGNAEGHRKMLAFQPSPSSANPNPSHILINRIRGKFGSEDNNTNTSIGSGILLKNNQNITVGPILPTYKSNSLNLSCIIEEEPPPGMMMSQIRDNSNEINQDPNANLTLIITNPNLNSPSSTSSHGNPQSTHTVPLPTLPGTTKKRSSSGERSSDKMSQSPEFHDSAPPVGMTSEKLKPRVGPPQSPPSDKNDGNANNEGNFNSIPDNFPILGPVEDGESHSPPQSAVYQKQGKSINGTKNVSLKRVSFGSSKGSMVETVIFESSISEEPTEPKTPPPNNGIPNNGIIHHSESLNSGGGGTQLDPTESPLTGVGGGSTGGSRPPSRVRVTFFESEKPLALSSPESDGFDYEITNMTTTSHQQTPLDPSTPNNYTRHISVESGWDNPFRPDGDLSKEADQIVELIKEGKAINDETLRSISPSVNGEMMHTSNYTQNLMASPPPGGKGTNGMEVQRGVVVPPSQTGAVEHVTLKKKKGCCVIQ